MARRKNVKRIDPRYFLHETANRNDDGSVFEACGECGEMGGEAIDIHGPGTEVHVDDISQLPPEEAFAAGIAVARDAIDQLMGGPPPEGGFSGNGPMGEPAMHEAAIEESYATTGIEPVHGDLWGKEEVQAPHGPVIVAPITDAGQRPSYARPPVSAIGNRSIEQFTNLKDQVKKMAEEGRFEGFSQIYVHPAPRQAGELMLYTVDDKKIHKNIREF